MKWAKCNRCDEKSTLDLQKDLTILHTESSPKTGENESDKTRYPDVV